MTSLNPAIPSAPIKTRPRVASSKSSQRYTEFVRWVRKSHGWVGLWGALFGLIFGFSGFWLNHRAVLKIPVAQERINAQLALPEPPPATAEEMSTWLQSSLGFKGPPNSIRVEPARAVAWTDKTKPAAASTSADAGPATPAPKAAPLMQPERWVFNFGGPNRLVQADYWRGNRSLAVTTTENGVVATLTNMHKGGGMSMFWILLIDTWAGSLIFLSLSGVILWVQSNRKRAIGVGIFSTALLVILGLTLTRL